MARKGKVVIANDFQVKTGASPAWVSLGKGMKYKKVRKDEQGTITYVDGKKEKFKAGEERYYRLEVADQDQATIAQLEALSGLARPFYIKLGYCNGKGQDLYIPEGVMMLDTDHESPSTNGLTNAFIIQPVEQDAAVSINPSTGLPTSCYAAAVNLTKTSDNNFDLIIET